MFFLLKSICSYISFQFFPQNQTKGNLSVLTAENISELHYFEVGQSLRENIYFFIECLILYLNQRLHYSDVLLIDSSISMLCSVTLL